MKAINYVLAAIILFTGNMIFAQEFDVNTSKSTVKWHGKKVLGEHDGAIMIKSGSMEIKDNMIVSGDFVIDMTSITNTDIEDADYNKKLVGHLKSDDFFGVEKFPTAQFVVTNSTKFNNNKATLTGDITIKGTTKSISFDVSRSADVYSAVIEIDRSDFDVRYGSNSFFDNLGDKAIDDIFTLNIELNVN